MTEERESRGELFLLSQAPEELRQPPSLENLLALHRGELNEAEETRIRRALVYHTEARELFAALELDLLEDAAAKSDDLTPEAVTADLDKVFQANSEEELRRAPPRAETSEDPQTPPLPLPSPNPPHRNLLKWAAMLLFGVVLGTVAGQMFQGSDGPKITPAEAKTLSPDGTRGEAPGRTAIAMPAARSLFLRLKFFDQPTYAEFRIELTKEGNGEALLILQKEGFHPTAQGTFELEMNRGSLPSGIYQFRLYGLKTDIADHLATYTVEF